MKEKVKKHIKIHYLLTEKPQHITHNILRIQDNNYIMCGFYCIAFIEYMLQEDLC